MLPPEAMAAARSSPMNGTSCCSVACSSGISSLPFCSTFHSPVSYLALRKGVAILAIPFPVVIGYPGPSARCTGQIGGIVGVPVHNGRLNFLAQKRPDIRLLLNQQGDLLQIAQDHQPALLQRLLAHYYRRIGIPRCRNKDTVGFRSPVETYQVLRSLWPPDRSLPPLHFHQEEPSIDIYQPINLLDNPLANLARKRKGLPDQDVAQREQLIEHVFRTLPPLLGIRERKERRKVLFELCIAFPAPLRLRQLRPPRSQALRSFGFPFLVHARKSIMLIHPLAHLRHKPLSLQ